MTAGRIQHAMTRPRRFAAVLAAMLAVLPGCSRWSRGERHAVARTASPSVRAAEKGLEMWSWVVSDGGASSPSRPARSPHRTSSRTTRRTSSRSCFHTWAARSPWMSRSASAGAARACGSSPCPPRRLERIVGSARLAGQVQRQWLGEVPEWWDAIRGVTLSTPRPVTLADGVITLSPGRPAPAAARLDRARPARAGDPPRGALHLEIAPAPGPGRPRAREDDGRGPGQAHAGGGRVSRRSRRQSRPGARDALVILADSPSADWATPPAPPPEDDTYGPHFRPSRPLGSCCSPRRRPTRRHGAGWSWRSCRASPTGFELLR
jgi:hypothetical protein